MLEEKYYNKTIILTKLLEANLILVDVSSEKNPVERFIVTIQAGQKIRISRPVTYEFHRGATGILKTNYYPPGGFLFDIEGAQITGHVGTRVRNGNLRPIYECQYASKELLELIME